MRVNRHSTAVFVLGITIAGGLVWLSGLPRLTSMPSPSGPANVPTSSAVGKQPQARSVAPAPSRPAPEPVGDRTAAQPAPVPADSIVWGTVETIFGDIVEGEKVKLYSASLDRRYSGTSNGQGEFRIDDVQPATDYKLSVKPAGMFRRYKRSNLEIEGVQTVLRVVLEPLRVGALRGEIVDAEGRPVPNFSIFVRSLSKDRGIRRVRSGPVGRFQVQDFPEGPLEVTAREHILNIRGLTFDPDSNGILTLVVDEGPHQLSGKVYDGFGHPHVGATVLLRWTHVGNDARTVVERQTLTDEQGAFNLDGLGAGRHQLWLAATDGSSLWRSVLIGEHPRQLIFHLEPDDSTGRRMAGSEM